MRWIFFVSISTGYVEEKDKQKVYYLTLHYVDAPTYIHHKLKLITIEYTSRSTLADISIKLLPRPGENDNTDIVLRSRNNPTVMDSDVFAIMYCENYMICICI